MSALITSLAVSMLPPPRLRPDRGKALRPLTQSYRASCGFIPDEASESVAGGFSLAGRSPQAKTSGRRLNAKAVVSVMPMVSAKASARIAAIFFMAVSLFWLREIARTGQDIRDGHHVLELFWEPRQRG